MIGARRSSSCLEQLSDAEAVGTGGNAAAFYQPAGMTPEFWLDPLSLKAPEFWLDPLSLKAPAQGWGAVLRKEQFKSSNDISHALDAANSNGTPLGASVLLGRMDFGAKGGSRLRFRTWTLRAASYDGSSTLRMYVNGNSEATQSVKDTIFTTADPFKIGGDRSGEMSTGLIDNVRISNNSASLMQLKTDIKTPVTVSTSSRRHTLTANAASSLTLLDGTHERWLAALILLAVLISGLYLVLPAGRSASGWPVLLFGLGGSALALFCGLLPGRKKLLRIPQCAQWRMLRSPIWEKGHVYFGLLSWLLLHCHARFRTGGPLTSVLLVVLWAIIGSGLAGLLFKHLLVLTKAGTEGKGLRAASVIATGHFLAQRLHVPLTLTLFILGAAHAVMALFY